jgi:alpha-tubulin suppressor-like RCC1 family protein
MATNTINIGKLMFYNRGQYGAGTAYSRDDIVIYGGNTYICMTPVGTTVTAQPPLISNNSGRLNANFWDVFQEGMSFRGTWTNTTVYYPGDIVNFGLDSYICRRQHTSSTYNKDPFYNPYNEWDELVKGDSRQKAFRAKMLQKRGPIGWFGHPFIAQPQWANGTGSTTNAWNGNIPFFIPAAQKRWEWAHSDGNARTGGLRSLPFISAAGRFLCSGVSGNHSNGPSNDTRPSASEFDCGPMRDYWNNANPTAGFKGNDWRRDYGNTMPTAIQLTSGYYDKMILYSNGTVVRHGYGGNGQNAYGPNNNSTDQGSPQINFPPGTFIVKLANSNQQGTDDNQHNLALDSDGYVWAWGNNSYGQLGLGNEIVQGKAIGMLNDVRGDFSTTGSYRDYENTVKRLPRYAFDGYRIVDIFAMGRSVASSYALDEAGQLWSWGYNGQGQLGFPTSTGFRSTDSSGVPFKFGRSIGLNWQTYGGIQKIMLCPEDSAANGYSSIYILDGQGYLWWCGYNQGTAVGNASTTASTGNAGNPIRITLSTAGGAPAGINGGIINFWVVGVGSSYPLILAMLSSGVVWGWGTQNYYELTDGTATARNYPVLVNGLNNPVNVTSSGHGNYPANAALVLNDFGSGAKYRIMVAGYNGYGQLGIGEATSNIGQGGQRGGHFHRVFGAGQFWWGPMYMPSSKSGLIRDVQSTGGTNEQNTQILFEDGTIFACGGANSGYYNIDPYSQGDSPTMRPMFGTN